MLSYTHLTDPRATRQQDLREVYGFICTCPSCSLPLSESRSSDINRARLNNVAAEYLVGGLYERKRARIEGSSQESSPDSYLDLINLMDREGFHDTALYLQLATLLISFYLKAGDSEIAESWMLRRDQYSKASFRERNAAAYAGMIY